MSAIQLRRAIQQDRQKIYQWLAQSDATAAMMGPPNFPDHPVPSYAEFCADYDDTAFQGADSKFQIFVISVDGAEIGATQFWIKDGCAELDIWIANRRFWGIGVGSHILNKLAAILKGKVNILIIRPSFRNQRAIGAYKKAGFEPYDPYIHHLPTYFLEDGFDYDDAVILVWSLESANC